MLRYIEADPLRARIVKRADEYSWSSFRVHGAGEPHGLVDPQLSPRAGVRQRRWAEKVHAPMREAELGAVRRSVATGLPFGEWVERLAKRLELDLVIRPRPRKSG